MRDIRNGGAGIGDKTAVGQAGRAEVWRQIHHANRFVEIAAQAKEHFGMAAEPTGFGPDSDRGTLRLDGTKRRADAIDLVIAAIGGNDAVGARAVEAFVGIQAGLSLGALRSPVAGAGFERGISNDVRAGGAADFHVVDEAFAGALEEDLKLIGSGE